PEGTWQTRLKFEVRGKRMDESVDIIDTVYYTTEVKRLNNNQFVILPDQPINLSYLLGSPNYPSRTATIYVNGSFQAVAGKHVLLSGSNLTLQNELNGIRTYVGSGTQSITFTLASSINTEQNYFYDTEATFTKGAFSRSLAIKATLFGNQEH